MRQRKEKRITKAEKVSFSIGFSPLDKCLWQKATPLTSVLSAYPVRSRQRHLNASLLTQWPIPRMLPLDERFDSNRLSLCGETLLSFEREVIIPRCADVFCRLPVQMQPFSHLGHDASGEAKAKNTDLLIPSATDEPQRSCTLNSTYRDLVQRGPRVRRDGHRNADTHGHGLSGRR